MLKNVEQIFPAPQGHWVGDGFPVRTLFSYQHAKAFSPFLLLDYAGPVLFPGDAKKRGVGQHPHRGFETVTIVYQGEVTHRDSTGQGGTIGPGDVQWMTAGAGIIHEEMHSSSFSREGGYLQMVQLWVNLPSSKKLISPRYQSIKNTDIPHVPLPDNTGELRVIAGKYEEKKGPADTFTPLNVWDTKLNADAFITLQLPEKWSAMVVVLGGKIKINDSEVLSDTQLALLSYAGSTVKIQSFDSSHILILSGEHINEPIVGHGPFVMNSEAEILQALEDYNSGKFGAL